MMYMCTSLVQLIVKQPVIYFQGKPHIVLGGPGSAGPQTPTSARIQPGLTLPRTPTTPGLAGNPAQKFVIMQQQRSMTPSQSIVKVVPNQQPSTPGSAQKIMVMSLPQSISASHTVQQVQVASGEPTMRTVFTTGVQPSQEVTVVKSDLNT